MTPRRAFLISLASALSFTLAGCIVGVLIGLIAPEPLRGAFRVGRDSAFDPIQVGLGSGAIAGFSAGAIVGSIGLVATLWPSLSLRRIAGPGSRRLSLSGALVLIVVCALGFASLRDPARIWVEVWFSLTALALAAATFAAIDRPIGRRGFAAGFAVLGWSHLLLSLFPGSREQLPTDRLLAILEKRITGGWSMGVQFLSFETGPFPARQRGAYWEPVVTGRPGLPAALQIDEVQPEFRRIGHSLFTLILATIGGVLGDRSSTGGRDETDAPRRSALGR